MFIFIMRNLSVVHDRTVCRCFSVFITVYFMSGCCFFMREVYFWADKNSAVQSPVQSSPESSPVQSPVQSRVQSSSESSFCIGARPRCAAHHYWNEKSHDENALYRHR